MMFTPINRGDLLLQRYEALEQIGAGGYGVVWKARQTSTGQLVAIKALVPSSRGDNTREIARFQREMQLIAQLSHPHIVNLIDSGITDDRRMMVLEFVDGHDLATVLRDSGPRTAGTARRIVLQVLDALSQAHGLGIIHRDLKPQNIMLTGPESRPNIKVLDFGIAGISDEKKGADYHTLTEEGMTPGTPAYMSPEQIRTGHTSPESDIYAVGLMLLECLTGERAYTGESVGDICVKQVTEPVPVPPWLLTTSLAKIVLKACAKDPAARYRSAEQMMADLERIESSGLSAVTMPPPDGAGWGASIGTGEISFEDPYRSTPADVDVTGGAIPSMRRHPASELDAMGPPSALPISSSVQTLTRSQSKGLLIGLGVVVLLGVAGAVGYMAAAGTGNATANATSAEGQGAGETVTPPAEDPSERPRAAADEAPTPEAAAIPEVPTYGSVDGTVGLPMPDPASAPEPEPAMVSWSIRAEPEARVVWQGATLCASTPCEVTLPAARLPVEVELSAEGYLAATLTLPDEGGNVDTQLRRRKRTTSGVRRRRTPNEAGSGDESGKRIPQFD